MDRIKILVVDDESRMRKLVRDFLEREGFWVLEAGDGMEAMDLFYDAEDGRMAGVQGGTSDVRDTDYYADGALGREGRAAGV